jgi:hypothetical protein
LTVLETGYGFGGTLPDGLVRDAAAGREVGKDCGGWHRGSGSGVQEMDAGFRIWRDIAEGNGIGGNDAWVEDMEGGNHKIGKDVFFNWASTPFHFINGNNSLLQQKVLWRRGEESS